MDFIESLKIDDAVGAVTVHGTIGLYGVVMLGIWGSGFPALQGAAGEATINLYQADLKGPLGIVMGAEGDGLRRLTRETCDGLISIPMPVEVSSLNVSVATGVCLFEAVRQRSCYLQATSYKLQAASRPPQPQATDPSILGVRKWYKGMLCSCSLLGVPTSSLEACSSPSLIKLASIRFLAYNPSPKTGWVNVYSALLVSPQLRGRRNP